MAYMNKNAELKNGYNAYIDSSVDDMGTQMDVGLLLMEAGDTYVYEDAKKEVAILLFSGSVTYEWDGKKVEADRPDCFHHDAYCLLAGCGTKVTITAKAHSELYIQATVNETPYEAVMYTPDKVQVEHKGFNGELMGCMSREIKTFFDLDNAPFSKMVLGEVLNLPGKWSSYPPHHHPQPEVYFYRFDYPDGFGAGFANVQPHSGAQANMAVQFAVLNPGDTIMGMNLDHGGHLTHGSPVNFSGTYFHIVPYGVNDEGFIDYDKVEEIAMECKPKMIIAGASAYARTIDFKRFREIADACGAVLMVDMAHIAGLVAAGLHPSPIPYAHVVTTTTHKTLRGPRGGMILSSQEIADKYNFNKAIFPGIQGGPLMHVIAAKAVCFKEALQPEFKVYQQNIIDNAQALCKGLLRRDIKIVSGGTDNHLMLVDLTNYDQTGKAVEKLLDSVNITCNKNTIPNDPRSPFVTSGVRLGTPAVTTRGMVEEDMDVIAEGIALVIKSEDNIEKVREMVKGLTDKYPLI